MAHFKNHQFIDDIYVPQCFGFVTHAVVNMECGYLFQNLVLVPLETYPEVELRGHRVVLLLIF